MKIATWNLDRPSPQNEVKIAAQLKCIHEQSADLWILTETHAAIDLGTGYHSAATDPSPRKPRPGESCAVIWARWPILERIPTYDEREAVCVVMNSPLGEMVVYGSIIPYRDYLGPDGTSGRWVEHRRSIDLHRQDWSRIRADHPSRHFVAGGDFNQNRDGAGWYGTQENRELLTNALKEAGLVCATQEDFVQSGKLKVRHTVDHICLDEDLAGAVSSVGAWERENADRLRLSDHSGVYVVVSR